MTIPVNTRSSQDLTAAHSAALQTAEGTNPEGDTAPATAFDSQLRALLSSSGGSQVNEEELFAAVIEERLGATASASVAEDFNMRFEQHKEELTRGDGYINVEKAANRALQDMVSVGHITATQREEIYNQSFMAAQLDDNHDALYDGRGGAGDDSIAVADLESALLSARVAIEALTNGELPPEYDGESDDLLSEMMEEDADLVTPEGTSVDGADEFVFKPESESDGKLVILLPQIMTGEIDHLLLKDENGNIIEEGRSTGVANGNREHFRFNRAGEDYPENITVEVRLASGEVKEYEIPNPGQRYD
ncbi:hypothetical protein MRY87_11925 [bacterium]|jgi:hypothetical protein|nr:hypothetical protein [bacterium]